MNNSHNFLAHFTSHNLNGILITYIARVDRFSCVTGRNRPGNWLSILVPLQCPGTIDLHQECGRFPIQHLSVNRLPFECGQVTVNCRCRRQELHLSNLHTATTRTLRIQRCPPVTGVSLVIFKIEFLSRETITDCWNVINLDDFRPTRSIIPSTDRIVCSLY